MNDINCFINHISRKKLVIKLLLWFRSLLNENNIPSVILDGLRAYIPSLSENIPDIQLINNNLKNNINYFNSREELMYAKRLESKQKTTIILKDSIYQPYMKKFYNVRIIDYYDIIEMDAIIDRVFTLDIAMDDPGDIFNFYKKTSSYDKKAFYYRLKLSTLTSVF